MNNPYNRRMEARLAREDHEMQVADKRTRRVEKERVQRVERTMKLDTWYDFHGDRLGCDRAYLESAILNGWTGDQIEALDVRDAGRLAGPPPPDPDHAKNLRKIQAAPVKPVAARCAHVKRIDGSHLGR